MKCNPLLVVADVAATSQWYRDLLGLQSGHGGGEFEMLTHGRDIVLLLHHTKLADDSPLTAPSGGTAGAGVLLYFSVDELNPVWEKAREMGADVINEPHENPEAHSVEFSLRDLDGYALTISEWKGS